MGPSAQGTRNSTQLLENSRHVRATRGGKRFRTRSGTVAIPRIFTLRSDIRRWIERSRSGLLQWSRCDSAATVRSGEQERIVANSGESQQQCLQRFSQSLQRNEAWSGHRESNPGSQLGKLSNTIFRPTGARFSEIRFRLDCSSPTSGSVSSSQKTMTHTIRFCWLAHLLEPTWPRTDL